MAIDLLGLKPANKIGEYLQLDWWHWRPIWDFVAHYLIRLSTNNFHLHEEFGGTIKNEIHNEMIIAITDAISQHEQNINSYHKEIKEITARHGRNYTFNWEKLKQFLCFLKNNNGFTINT